MGRRALHLGVATVASVLLFFEIIPWRCPFALITGVPCPTCGFTRAIRALTHGDLRAAFHFHPLWPAIVLVLIGIVVTEAVRYLRDGTFGGYPKNKTLYRVAFGVAVATFVVWIARFAMGNPVAV